MKKIVIKSPSLTKQLIKTLIEKIKKIGFRVRILTGTSRGLHNEEIYDCVAIFKEGLIIPRKRIVFAGIGIGDKEASKLIIRYARKYQDRIEDIVSNINS